MHTALRWRRLRLVAESDAVLLRAGSWGRGMQGERDQAFCVWCRGH